MNINRSGLFWGLLLIGAGIVALGQQMGYIDQFSDPQVWIWIFGIVSFLAFLNYALSSWRQWGWQSQLLSQQIMWIAPPLVPHCSLV